MIGFCWENRVSMKIRFIFCGLLVCNMVGRARPYVAPVMDCQEKTPELVGGRSIEEGPKLSEVVRVRLAQKISKLPLWNVSLSDKTPFDWLLTPEKSKAGIYRSADGKSIVMANGMVARTFRIFPNLATTHLTNRMNGESMIRAVSGEGFLQINGKKWSVGGLSGQPERAYLREDWIEKMNTIPKSFLIEDFEIREVGETLPWARNR